MAGSFTKKRIQVNISLASGTFDGSNNTIQLQGLRVECHVKKGGHPSKNECKLKVYGLSDADMNKLTTMPSKDKNALVVHKSIVQVLAGDSDGMAVVFSGNIVSAFAAYQSPPNLAFEVTAMEGYYPSIAPSKPKSFKGVTQVSTILKTLAGEMGYSYEDGGVDATLNSPILEGSAWAQASEVADSCDLEFGADDGVMFAAPRHGVRSGYVPLISPDSGLREYPVFDKEGLRFSCLYNPALRLGGAVSVKSAVKVACGTWRIHGLDHQLESENPNGKWFSDVRATWIGS